MKARSYSGRELARRRRQGDPGEARWLATVDRLERQLVGVRAQLLLARELLRAAPPPAPEGQA